MEPWQCLTCGEIVLAGSRFCSQCGADLREQPKPQSPAGEIPLVKAARVVQLVIYVFGAAFFALLVYSVMQPAPSASPGQSQRIGIRCRTCGGSGKVVFRGTSGTGNRPETCPVCSGTGTE